MRIKVLVDDLTPADVRSVHGFSALVETADIRLLFDTGPDGEVLMEALAREDVEVVDLDMVVLSHAHRDHSGGLARLLFEWPELEVSAPRRVAPDVAKGLPREAVVVGEDGPRELAPNVTVTGDLGGDIPEQALLIETDEGRVMLVGCGHPGIQALLGAAEGDLRLRIGGIHDLGPEEAGQFGPGAMIVCHCTPSKRILSHRFEHIALGEVGTVVEIADGPIADPP